MLSRKNSIEKRRPFGDPAPFEGLQGDAVMQLAMAGGDITLVLDDKGQILDASANAEDFPGFEEWIGNEWFDTVTVESQAKLMEMLASARKGQVQRWRQVNHTADDGDIPVSYVVINTGDSGRFIAIGRNMREAASLQQRLLQAQQALERDYIRLRQNQTRYRLLLEKSPDAVLVIEHDNYRIREANPAADRLLGEKRGALVGNKLLPLFAPSEREALIEFMGSAMTSDSVSPRMFDLREGEARISITASGFRQQGGRWLLLHLAPAEGAKASLDGPVHDVVEAMPDAFVLADEDMRVVAANLAFVELIGAASIDQIRGKALDEFVGRPGIDLDLIRGQLAKSGYASNVMTVVGEQDDGEGEPVELSAVQTGGSYPHVGFVLRSVGRRLRDLPPSSHDLPRSVEQLTELVGRMSLKDIVRESTDLIERLCIEAALTYTSDNRASAAEILGLSRQSLYSKLNRYGFSTSVAKTD
ncbi:transcriptional regulator PpsR [Aurantiacibacter odishensis]|uniref:transcriptional regulator PpsR n=1 Tax=Aurantiacibacter odishensis TaxID=1155476 RepID=UPI000E770CF2|nr:transcriptional regulator PpsR [Aurantiacibacter odishensis]